MNFTFVAFQMMTVSEIAWCSWFGTWFPGWCATAWTFQEHSYWWSCIRSPGSSIEIQVLTSMDPSPHRRMDLIQKESPSHAFQGMQTSRAHCRASPLRILLWLHKEPMAPDIDMSGSSVQDPEIRFVQKSSLSSVNLLLLSIWTFAALVLEWCKYIETGPCRRKRSLPRACHKAEENPLRGIQRYRSNLTLGILLFPRLW